MDVTFVNLLLMFPLIFAIRIILDELKPRKAIVVPALAILLYYGRNYDWTPLFAAELVRCLFPKKRTSWRDNNY